MSTPNLAAPPNPFPDYPVSIITDDTSRIRQQTIETPAIAQERELIWRYQTQWQTEQLGESIVEPIVVAVRGDYGTGKTHLLLDAVASFSAPMSSEVRSSPSLRLPPYAIRVPCIEADPATWYQSVVGPAISMEMLEKLVLGLYAEAGQVVAAEAPITSHAVDILQRRPEAIRKLIGEDLLNTTAVRSELFTLVSRVIGPVSEDVRRACAGLIGGPSRRAAMRWLAGERLSGHDLQVLGPSSDQCDEKVAAEILVLIAALSRHLGQPFGLFIDELEHLARFQGQNQSRGNVTWLKRLLEALARHKPLVVVAGHWDAWTGESDYFERFSRPISLLRLDAGDVLELVQARVPNLSPELFGPPEAALVAEATKGNIRRVFTLCRELFRDTGGFQTRLTAEHVTEIAERAGQRVPLDEAIAGTEDVFESLGLQVRAKAVVADQIAFDLVGYSGGEPRVAADFRRALTDPEQVAEVRRFVERVREVRHIYPALVGCFILDGRLDQELSSLAGLTNESGLAIFDLSERQVFRAIANGLEVLLDARQPVLQSSGEARVGPGDSARVAGPEDGPLQGSTPVSSAQPTPDAATSAQLDRRLGELEAKRAADQAELRARLEALQAESVSERSAAVTGPTAEELAAKVNLTYAELTRSPSLSERLGVLAVGPDSRWLLFALLLIVAGLVFLAVIPLFISTHPTLEPGMDPALCNPCYSNADLARSNLINAVVSAILLLTGIWLILRQMRRIDAFYNFRGRVLRQVYLRDSDPYLLSRVDNVLRSSLERYGSVRGRREAANHLRPILPEQYDDFLVELDNKSGVGDRVKDVIR